jgi:hypothetical protein
MTRRHLFLPLLAAVAAIAACWTLPASAVQEDGVLPLVARVGERLATYYRRAQQIICTERDSVLPIGTDWSVQGFERTVESELRLEIDGEEDARVVREIRRINGRLPRERDRTDRSACTDPAPLTPEVLAFLLPRNRAGYTFSADGSGRERDRDALVIAFASLRRSSRPTLVEDPSGHDDCFDWKGPLALKGRLWVDAETLDVLRLDRSLAGPADVAVPQLLQHKYLFDPWLTLDRDDLALRYKPYVFSDPDETVLLPESIVSTTVFRRGLQSTRRVQTFTDYRRFLTGGRVIKVR